MHPRPSIHTPRVATRVLIVDDHESFRATVRLLLESEGYEVVGEAADGRGAIACNEALGPDVVLLDVNLPDLDGFEVAGRLVQRASPPSVILTSNREAADFGALVEQSPARGFISKPDLSGSALERMLA